MRQSKNQQIVKYSVKTYLEDTLGYKRINTSKVSLKCLSTYCIGVSILLKSDEVTKLGAKAVNRLIDLTYKEYAESLAVLIARTPYEVMSVIKCNCWYNKPGEVRIYLKDLNNNDLGYIAVKNVGTVQIKVSGHIRNYIDNCITALNNVFRLEHSTGNDNNTKPILCFNCQTNIAVKDGLCNRCY